MRVQEGVPKDWEFKRRVLQPDVLSIIETAMAVDITKRYGSGDQMASACELALHPPPKARLARLAAYMHSMFSREHGDGRAHGRPIAGSRAAAPVGDGHPCPRRPRPPPSSQPGASAAIPRDGTAPIIELGPATRCRTRTWQEMPPSAAAAPWQERPAVRASGPHAQVRPRTAQGGCRRSSRAVPSGALNRGHGAALAAHAQGAGRLEQATQTVQVRSRVLHAWFAVFGAAAPLVGLVVVRAAACAQLGAPVEAQKPHRPWWRRRQRWSPCSDHAHGAPARTVAAHHQRHGHARLFLDPSPTQSALPSLPEDESRWTYLRQRVDAALEADNFKSVSLPVVGAGERPPCRW